MDKKLSHFPVLANEIVSYIDPKNNGLYLDCTFGQGGFTNKIFEKDIKKANVIAIDQDSDAKIYVDRMIRKFNENFFFFYYKFSEIEKVLEQIRIKKI